MAIPLFTGCFGEQARVETGEVGRVVGSDGFEGGIIRTSSFRMPYCNMGMACPYLVRMQTAKDTQKVNVEQVFLTKSKVDLSNVEAGVQYQVKGDDRHIDLVFSEVPSNEQRVVTLKAVWSTYLERKVPATIVAVLRDYTVEDILSKIPEIEDECKKRLTHETKDLPVAVTDIGFPNGIGDIPEKVINSYRNLYAVEADKQRQIKQLAADLEVERQRIVVQQVRAKNDKAVSQQLGMPIGTYMSLKIDEKYSDAVADAADNNQPFALGSFPVK